MDRCGYDTVILKSENHPSNYIPDLTGHTKSGGQVWQTGPIEGMRITINAKGTTIQGSFATSLRGNNLMLADIQDVTESLNKLSNLLGLDLFQAKVTRIDFAQDIFTDNPPKEYYPYLGPMPRRERITYKRSLYYQIDREKLALYDKSAQMKGKDIPQEVEGKNILRCEMRLTKKLEEIIGRSVTGETLAEPGLFNQLSERHLKIVKSIQMIQPCKLDIRGAKTSTTLALSLNSFAVHEIGLEACLGQLVKPTGPETKAEKQARYNKRKLVLKAARTEVTQQPNKLVEELKTKIATAGRNAL